MLIKYRVLIQGVCGVKGFFFFVSFFAVVFSAKAQDVLFIKGANSTIPTVSVTSGASLNVLGGINIDQAGSAVNANNNYLQNNGTVQILSDGLPGQSDFTNNVTGLKTFTTGQTTGEVIFAANSETQLITGGGTVEFMNLTVNNILAPKVNLSEDVTVDGVLKIGGLINLQNNNLTLLSSGSIAGAPYSSTNMVEANETGQFILQINAGAASFLFPLGDTTPAYSPVTINFVSNAVGGKVGLNLRAVTHPQMNNPTAASDYISRYWTFSDSGLTNYSYTGTFQYLSSDIHGVESKMKLSRWANPWYSATGSSAATDVLTITTPLNETLAPLSGDFTGRNACSINLVITAQRDTVCNQSPGKLIVSGSSGNVQWQSSLSPSSGFTNISGATDTVYTSLAPQTTYFKVYGSNGNCTDTSEAFKLVILPSPVATFTYTSNGKQVVFNSTGSSGAALYHWDFGDGTISNDTNPVHTFSVKDSFNVCLTVYNGSNCSFTYCETINLLTGVIPVLAENDLTVYPNPFSDNFSIKGSEGEIQSVEVYDLLGKMVFNQDYEGQFKNIQVNLTGVPESMYFLKIKTENGDYVERIIKQ